MGVLTLVRSLPSAIADLAADRMEQIVLDVHAPEDLGPELGRVCLRCRTDAPCKEWMATIDRRADRLGHGGQRWIKKP